MCRCELCCCDVRWTRCVSVTYWLHSVKRAVKILWRPLWTKLAPACRPSPTGVRTAQNISLDLQYISSGCVCVCVLQLQKMHLWTVSAVGSPTISPCGRVPLLQQQSQIFLPSQSSHHTGNHRIPSSFTHIHTHLPTLKSALGDFDDPEQPVDFIVQLIDQLLLTEQNHLCKIWDNLTDTLTNKCNCNIGLQNLEQLNILLPSWSRATTEG